MGNNNTKSVFKEYIHPLDLKVIQKMIDHENLDKYVKALCAYFVKLFIYAQLMGLSSLGRTSEKVKRKKGMQRIVTSISSW